MVLFQSALQGLPDQNRIGRGAGALYTRPPVRFPVMPLKRKCFVQYLERGRAGARQRGIRLCALIQRPANLDNNVSGPETVILRHHRHKLARSVVYHEGVVRAIGRKHAPGKNKERLVHRACQAR